MKRHSFILLALVALTVIAVGGVYANQSTVCPHDAPWVKIDSNDLSQYPVEGAIEYCFKGGNVEHSDCEAYLVYGSDISVIPDGDHVCGLSHWSYRLEEPTATPENTPTSTPENTPTNTPEDTPTSTPDITPTSPPRSTPTPITPPKTGH